MELDLYEPATLTSTTNNKIIVFNGLNSDRVLFSGKSLSKKIVPAIWLELWLYNVSANLKAAMVERYIYYLSDTLYDFTRKSDKACSLCTATQPCTKDDTMYCCTYKSGSWVRNYFRNIWPSKWKFASVVKHAEFVVLQ